jgi:hypothetical protein
MDTFIQNRTSRIRMRKYRAHAHKSPAVSQATSEVLKAKGLGALETDDERISAVLLTAACISMVKKRLPLVRQ